MNVFDFDNTIYDGESTLDLFFFYIVRKPRLIKYMPAVLKAFAQYKKGDISLTEVIERYVPIVEGRNALVWFWKWPESFLG